MASRGWHRRRSSDVWRRCRALYGYLVIRGDAVVWSRIRLPWSVEFGATGHQVQTGAPLVRGVRRLPRILNPDEVEALMAGLRTDRDRAMAQAMLLGGLRRGEVLGPPAFKTFKVPGRGVFIADGKGGHQRLVPISERFFATKSADYHEQERPSDAPDRSPSSSPCNVWRRLRQGPLERRDHRDHSARAPGRGLDLPTSDLLIAVAPHLRHQVARGRHGDLEAVQCSRPAHRPIGADVRRIDLSNLLAIDWLAEETEPWKPSAPRWRWPR